MRLGPVHLTVADLRRSIAWYEDAIGLAPLEDRDDDDDDGGVAIGVGGEPLLVLSEQPGARPSHGYCGLYHVALLVPERRDLAEWLAHAIRERIALAGVADHFVSEALYLSDPDGHGLEIYADRPREVWEGQVAQRMGTLPLDTRSLLAELGQPAHRPFSRLAPGTRIGHVHLRVSGLAPTIVFYREILGLQLMAELAGQAAFLAEGGYHHHIGANTWESAGRGQPPPGSASLRRVTLSLAPERLAGAIAAAAAAGLKMADVEQGTLLHDPSGNPILLAEESR